MHEQITELCKEGDALASAGMLGGARQKYIAALKLLPAVHREFEAGTDTVSTGVTYTFDQGGTVQIRRESFAPHRVETATSSFDPAPGFATWPAFGQYDDLIRIERQQIP